MTISMHRNKHFLVFHGVLRFFIAAVGYERNQCRCPLPVELWLEGHRIHNSRSCVLLKQQLAQEAEPYQLDQAVHLVENFIWRKNIDIFWRKSQ